MHGYILKKIKLKMHVKKCMVNMNAFHQRLQIKYMFDITDHEEIQQLKIYTNCTVWLSFEEIYVFSFCFVFKSRSVSHMQIK